MKRALYISLVLILATGMGFSMISHRSTTATKTVQCPLVQMGQPCPDNCKETEKATCPYHQKDKCANHAQCDTTGKCQGDCDEQVKCDCEYHKNKCAYYDKCSKEGKCVGTCDENEKANCELHTKCPDYEKCVKAGKCVGKCDEKEKAKCDLHKKQASEISPNSKIADCLDSYMAFINNFC